MDKSSTLQRFVLFGCLAAILRPLKNMGHKQVLITGPESLEANLCFWVAIVAFLTPYTIYHYQKKKQADRGFQVFPRKHSLLLLLGATLLDASTFVVYMHALKYEDFSLIIPIRNLVPVFPFFWSIIVGVICILRGKDSSRTPIQTKDSLSLLLVIMGVFLLTLNFQKDFLAELLTTPCLLAFVTAMMFAMTVFVQSYALSENHGNMDVTIFTTLMIGIKVIVYAGALGIKGTLTVSLQTFQDYYGTLVFIGIVGFFTSIAIMQVIKLATDLKEKEDIQSAPLLSTIMLRGQVLPSVILGGLWFQEENLLMRSLGALALTAGIALIATPKEALLVWLRRLKK